MQKSLLLFFFQNESVNFNLLIRNKSLKVCLHVCVSGGKVLGCVCSFWREGKENMLPEWESHYLGPEKLRFYMRLF